MNVKLRHFNALVSTKMHGFLNVLGAGVFAREHGWDVIQTAAMLADEDRAAIRFFDAGLTWRGERARWRQTAPGGWQAADQDVSTLNTSDRNSRS